MSGRAERILDAWRSARSYMGFIGTIFFGVAFHLSGSIEIALLVIVVMMLAYGFCFGIPLHRGVIEVLENIEENTRRMPNSSEEGEMEGKGREKEDKVKPSGGGAIGGMVAGGLLGLPFGSTGVLIGGILGTIVGNHVEYEIARRKR